jgi:hypothetical protein
VTLPLHASAPAITMRSMVVKIIIPVSTTFKKNTPSELLGVHLKSSTNYQLRHEAAACAVFVKQITKKAQNVLRFIAVNSCAFT